MKKPITYREWKKRLIEHAIREQTKWCKKHYGEADWQEYHEQEFTPEEAYEEEMSYAAGNL